tara:strand:- start:24 stop:1343 length:1320 start_codon:yes stop_codon:yes gene_type:complete
MIFLKKILQLRSLIFFFTAVSISGETFSYDLLKAFIYAQNYESQFASERSLFDANKEKRIQSRSFLLPKISLNAITRQIDGNRGTFDFNYDSSSYQIQLIQPIYNREYLKIYQQSKIQVSVSEIQFDKARTELALKVANAYFDVLVAQDEIGFIQSEKKSIKEQLALAKKNFEIGTATITDSHEAQARFDLALSKEILAQNKLEVKRNSMMQITGKFPPILKSLKSEIELNLPKPSSIKSWIKAAMSFNHEVVIQQLKTEIAKLEIIKNKSAFWPKLDATANYSNARNVNPFFPGKLVQNSIGIEFNLPIFSGFSNSSRIKEAVFLKKKAIYDLATAKRNAAHQARTSFLGIQSGLSQINALKAAEVSSQSALDSNLLGYDVGVRINIDVLNAQQQLYSTRKDLAKARYETIMSGLKLKAASGKLDEDDLAAINLLLSN